MEALRNYDAWKLQGPHEPKCDEGHGDCPNRFHCEWIDWPFTNWQEEDDAMADGTYVGIVEDAGL